TQLYIRLVVEVLLLNAGGTEDGGGFGHLTEGIEIGEELALDAQNTPRVGVFPVMVGPHLQQALIEGAALGLGFRLPAEHGPDEQAVLIFVRGFVGSHGMTSCSAS